MSERVQGILEIVLIIVGIFFAIGTVSSLSDLIAKLRGYFVANPERASTLEENLLKSTPPEVMEGFRKFATDALQALTLAIGLTDGKPGIDPDAIPKPDGFLLVNGVSKEEFDETLAAIRAKKDNVTTTTVTLEKSDGKG